jgi:hypothetical protein
VASTNGRGCLPGDGDRLEAGFREGERRGRRVQGLETDLLQRVGEKPALQLDAVLGGAFAGLEFVQGGFGAVGEDFVVEDRGVEGRDEFEQIGLALKEVGEEIGILRGQGAELIEEGLLGLQFLAERTAWVAVHEYLLAARARRGDAQGDRRGVAPRRMWEIQSAVPEIY